MIKIYEINNAFQTLPLNKSLKQYLRVNNGWLDYNNRHVFKLEG